MPKYTYTKEEFIKFCNRKKGTAEFVTRYFNIDNFLMMNYDTYNETFCDDSVKDGEMLSDVAYRFNDVDERGRVSIRVFVGDASEWIDAYDHPDGMTSVFVHVQCSRRSNPDYSVRGIHEVRVPFDVSTFEQANIALDVFHTHVAIDDLDDFTFTVRDSIKKTKAILDPDACSSTGDWVEYSGSELGEYMGQLK